MSFGSPLVLLALLIVPFAIARYLAGERARRRRAQAFASPRMMPSVAPAQPRWRRHVPLVLYGIALAVLIVAAARPRATVAVPVEQATVMLVTDVSGSMESTDVKPSRLSAARDAAATFAKGVPHGVRLGVMAFNQHPRTLQPPTADRGAVNAALAQLASSGGTATGEALDAALTVLQRQPGGPAPPPRRHRPPPARGDRPALRRQVDAGPGPARGGRRRRAAEDPHLHRRPRHVGRHDPRAAPGRRRRVRDAAGAARPRHAARGRARLARSGLLGRGRRPARHRLPPPGLAARHPRCEARDHRRVRRRCRPAPRRGRRALAALVRATAMTDQPPPIGAMHQTPDHARGALD